MDNLKKMMDDELSLPMGELITIFCIFMYICDCLSENPPSSHLPVFREIPF